jgi:methyl-accepting chemotaxis protein
MYKRYLHYFLHEYESADFFTQIRARLLIIFQSIFLLMTVVIQFSMLFAGWKDFVNTIYITPLLFSGIAISMSLLRKGRYSTGANLCISFAIIAVIAGLLRQPYLEKELSYTSYIYFVYPCMAMCAIFTTLRFLTIVAGSLMAANIALFAIMLPMSENIQRKVTLIAFNNISFSLVVSYIIFLLVIRVFSRTIEATNAEAGKNERQNIFIKRVLKESSERVVAGMHEMSDRIQRFSENTREQASSIEQATAAAEEVSAGVDSVSMIAREQSERLAALTGILDELTASITQANGVIAGTLSATDTIAHRAREGESSLHGMKEGIERIGHSSSEMKNIIGIINDISDQINLLSLNAAIEAARAGDAGRGFAVVADEISKLADRTATSIKNIESLIGASERDIQSGIQSVASVVDGMGSIMRDVNGIGEKIKSLSTFTGKQSDTNGIVNDNARSLRDRAEEIRRSADEQKTALSDIVETFSDVNELSQSNSSGAEEMAADAKKLLAVVSGLSNAIENYRDEA